MTLNQINNKIIAIIIKAIKAASKKNKLKTEGKTVIKEEKKEYIK